MWGKEIDAKVKAGLRAALSGRQVDRYIFVKDAKSRAPTIPLENFANCITGALMSSTPTALPCGSRKKVSGEK